MLANTKKSAISRIKLAGFKSIKSAELDFKNLNVFIGANGSGKSNFISFFQMLEFFLGSNEGLAEYVGRNGGSGALMYFGNATTNSIEAEVAFDTDLGMNMYRLELGNQIGGKLYFKDERVSFCAKGQISKTSIIPLGSGGACSRLLQISENDTDFNESQIRTTQTIRGIMRKWSFYQFHNTATDTKIRTASHINDNSYLRSNGENLAAFLFMLQFRFPTVFFSIVDTIRQIAPFINKLELKEEYASPYVRIKWSENPNTDYLLDASQMSDGTIRALALVTLLMQPNRPPLICIDEPELGLHPEAIMIIGDLIKIASENTQIIVSTQSEKLIDCFEPEDIVVVDKGEDGTKFNRLDYEKYKVWLDDYSISETWETNVIGGRP